MDTEKQRQRRRDDAENGNARSEQLNTCGAYRVTNQQSLACLSGSECGRPGWFLDMNMFDEPSVKISLHCVRAMRWVLFRVNFRPMQEIKAKYGGGRIFDTGPFLARLRYTISHQGLLQPLQVMAMQKRKNPSTQHGLVHSSKSGTNAWNKVRRLQ